MIIKKPEIGLPPIKLHALSKGLVGEWLMRGEGAAYDTSGFENDGALVNAPVRAASLFGSGILLNGTNQSINCGAEKSLKITGPFTISIWTKPTTISGVDALISMWDTASSDRAYRLLVIDGKIYLPIFDESVADSQLGRTAAAITLSAGVWYHIVGTYDGGTTAASLKIYLDGIRVDDTDNNGGSSGNFVSIEQVAANFTIGSSGDGTFPFDGNIDQVLVWNREFTADEVTKLYAEPFARWERQSSWFYDFLSPASPVDVSKFYPATSSLASSGGMVGREII